MANGFIVVDDKDWEKASQEQRDWMTYNTMRKIDTRLTKLERKPIIDKACAFAGGVVGGALAYLGIKTVN
jgi:hypothetical protein